MKVLELYSGIGGMHAALEISGLDYEVVKAFDINDSANFVYNMIYNCSYASNRSIESLSEKECRAYNADLWTMSPPCQPFTRMGNQKQGKDARCSSFHVVIDLIRRIKPPAIFLENVKGFEGSDAWKKLIKTLIESDYDIRFGIPNCRLRYYIIANRGNHGGRSIFEFGDSVKDSPSRVGDLDSDIMRLPIFDVDPLPDCGCVVCTRKVKHIISVENDYEQYLTFCNPVSDYLLNDEELPDDLYLGQNLLQKYYRILDIVEPHSHKSACFTKGYAQRYEGTGSFLQLSEVPQADDGGYAYPELRRFHSKEIANLLCFPESFKFPQSISEKQRLKLLGNSLNVRVVAHIMHWTLAHRE